MLLWGDIKDEIPCSVVPTAALRKVQGNLPALTAIKMCFGGNIGIKEHTLHAFEVLYNVVVVSINVFGFRKLGTCWMGVFLR